MNENDWFAWFYLPSRGQLDSSIGNSRESTSIIISMPPGKILLVVISRSLCECHINAKPASPEGEFAIVPDGGTVPYPPLTKDMHHEVELIVALKSGWRNIAPERAPECIFGYGVGIDLTRRDLQIASRDMKRPWEIGKACDASAPCGALQPAARIGHPGKGRIALSVNGKVRQEGDLSQMIWRCPR